MNKKEILDTENSLMANVFAKKPIVLVEGKGVLVWDIQGKEYLDFSSSYGVAALGHSHPKIVKAINEQAEKIISCHSGFYNPKRAELLQKLVNLTPKGLNKIFLSNSGAESIECAIKLARKFTGKTEIIAFMGAYHGKTMGALSATWDKKYRSPFEPLVPNFKHVPPDNLEKLQKAITEKTAAILIEPIRGEGGIRLLSQGFLQEVREICDKQKILLILDEVQTSFGRTGKLFAFEHWKITPDILCLAKPFAGGLPIGITIAKKHIMSSLKTGEHTSTFSGSPVVCAAAIAAITIPMDITLSHGNGFVTSIITNEAVSPPISISCSPIPKSAFRSNIKVVVSSGCRFAFLDSIKFESILRSNVASPAVPPSLVTTTYTMNSSFSNISFGAMVIS